MPLPLFPENGEPLFIKQGSYGSCFVETVFQIIFDSGPKGREFLSSIFTYTSEGLRVKLAHSQYSRHLKPRDFALKYRYERDRKYDVFLVYPDTLEEIASFDKGVETNAFALKVLERLVANYFAFDWDRWRFRGSLYAYNVNIQQRHPDSSSEAFLGAILGLKISKHLDKELVIRLKTLDQELPVYVSIKYAPHSELHTRHTRHTRHALIIDEVHLQDDSSSVYGFSLINPWDNQSSEFYNLIDLEKRDPTYKVFVVDEQAHEQRMYIVCNPPLFNLICEARHSFPTRLVPDLIKHLSALYREMPYLPEVISTIPDKRRLYTYIAASPVTKEDLIRYIWSKFSHVRLAEVIIQQESASLLAADNDLARMAFQEKNSLIYHYLVRNKFDFPEFLRLIGDRRGEYIRTLLEIEEEFLPLSYISKLRRLQRYVDRLFVEEIPLSALDNSPFIEESQTRLISLCLVEALRIIYDHADKISKFTYSFKQCKSPKEVAIHYKTLLSIVDKMRLHHDLIEATQSLMSVRKNEDHFTIIGAITKLKVDIKKAKIAQESYIYSMIKRPTSTFGVLKQRFFSTPINLAETPTKGFEYKNTYKISR